MCEAWQTAEKYFIFLGKRGALDKKLLSKEDFCRAMPCHRGGLESIPTQFT